MYTLILFSFLLLYKYTYSIKRLFHNWFVYFLWKFVDFYQPSSLNDYSVLSCYYFNKDNTFGFLDTTLPIQLNNSYSKLELEYQYSNKKYRYVEKNMNKKILKFPIYSVNIMKNLVGNKGILSAEIINNNNKIDISSLLLEYQGPLKNFYQDIPDYTFLLSDIRHESIQENSILYVLDINFNTYNFKFNDVIRL